LTIHQDARLYLASLLSGEGAAREIERGRAGWLQVLRGGVNVLGNDLAAGDGVAITVSTPSRFRLPFRPKCCCSI